MVHIERGKICVRKIQLDDAKTLSTWLSNPLVLAFYEGRDSPFTVEKVKRKFFRRNDSTLRCIIEYEGKAIGYVQIYEVHDNPYEKRYGMDQFIGEPTYWNRGIGTKVISAVVEYLRSDLGATVIQMDPQVSNSRAIRAYEKCGFRKVRTLPKHEFHEGAYRDCVLMEYVYERKGS